MEKIDSLRDIIKFNSSFKTSINLYLSLNKSEKVLGYIPTKSSVNFMGDYIKAVLDNKEQATLLVGPYGKGKSHLLLVLLAILSMKRSPENNIIISELIDKVSKVDEVGNVVSKLIKRGWDKKRFLPVLITDTTGDLNQAFLYGLNDALKRDGLLDLVPDTYYSIALERISDWEQNYYETYTFFEKEVVNCGSNMSSLKAELKLFSKEALEMFKAIYPKVMDDVLKGSTDFSVAKSGLKHGWKVYIRFDLHAKTYIIDNKRGLVGSANATNSGLSIGKSGNMEMATLVDVEPQDIEKVNKLFYDAIEIDDLLLEKLQRQLDQIKSFEDGVNYKWDKSITAMFNPHIDTLFSYELPEDFILQEGEYFSFMDETFSGDFEKLKEAFRWSNAYLWLLTVLKENEGCLYYGVLSEKLHNAMVSDPKPYRRDVKKMLSNLLLLIQELNMEEITIDRPNYSQRVRLTN